MNTTKRLIEQLEKLTNKKVMLQENVGNCDKEIIDEFIKELTKHEENLRWLSRWQNSGPLSNVLDKKLLENSQRVKEDMKVLNDLKLRYGIYKKLKG